MDKNYNVVTVGIPYNNLQWNRRYYEAGSFSVVVPNILVDDSWAYICCADRPEVGMVQKKTINDDETTISGFFAEKMLDDKVCFPWYRKTFNTVEQAARDMFSTYKEDLPITMLPANNPLIGTQSAHNFSDDELGKKLYATLEPFEASYRVIFDYSTVQLKFGVWKGLDRRQSQTVNPYQVFSTEFGNIEHKSVNIDDSDFKNFAVVPFDENDEGRELGYLFIDLSNGGYKRKIVYDYRSTKPGTDTPYDDIEAIRQEATESLLERQSIVEVDIDVTDEGYMTDYDLGDNCDIVLKDVGVSMSARIVEVSEVYKASGSKITIGLGNKRIDNMQRMLKR